MSYIGKAPQLQGAYEKADSISGQFNGSYTQFNIKVGGSNKSVGKATNIIVGFTEDSGGMGDNPGVRQLLEPDTDYTVSGYLITFNSGNFKIPVSGDHCWITILGDVLSPNA
ncbi:MAG: hypothetical protein DRQ78_09645 [Epsilonproteobacteria bacterium]|nr:MAG: hypothetical protein DRQ78_09645 [Campylobacterota bacterium]